jgi:hypothetical protein
MIFREWRHPEHANIGPKYLEGSLSPKPPTLFSSSLMAQTERARMGRAKRQQPSILFVPCLSTSLSRQDVTLLTTLTEGQLLT